MECRVPEYGNESLDDFWRKVESVNDDDLEYVLHMVHKTREHADNGCPNEEERRVNLDLANQCSGSLVFPDHVEVRFETPECEDECDEKTASTDKSEFFDGNVFGVFDNVHDLLGRPVQIEHVNHDGEVVRNEVTETDGERDGGEHDEQGNDCHERRVGQRCRTGHSVIVQERLSGDNHDFDERRRTGCDMIEQPLPRKIFPPMRHTRVKYS